MNKEVKKIQVPYSLIDNTIKKQHAPYQALYLYVILKSVCKNNHVNIYVEKLKSEDYLDWKSTKTLKKYLDYLKDNKYIIFDFETMPKHKPLQIDIIPIKEIPKKDNRENHFVQISVEYIKNIITKCKCIKIEYINKKTGEIINKTYNLKEMALKLFYYYRKMYNDEYRYACPSYKQTYEATGISREYINILNNFFSDNGLVEVQQGKWYSPNKETECENETDNKEEKSNPRRERNRYIPYF